jgi:hypothetical protein
MISNLMISNLASATPMLLALQLSHFSAAAIFALFASIVFGISFRSDPRDMVRHGAYCFAMFLGLMMLAAWVMRFLHR